MQITHRTQDDGREYPAPGAAAAVCAPAAAATGPVEVELKLAVPESAREALQERLRSYGAARDLQMDSVYFDTRGRTLASQRAALRVRRVDSGAGAGWVQTLKTGSTSTALTRRGEWEVPVAGARLAPSKLAASPLRELLGKSAARLAPVFRTSFHRSLFEVRTGGALIELAFDQGHVLAGRRREAICELELEVRGGEPAAVYELALALMGRGREALALMPSVESKAARGYRLADREAPAPLFAGAEGFIAVLEPDMDCATAARRIVEHGVNLVLANLAGSAAGDDLEFVHQSRVALRRTRSALRLFEVARGAGDPVARNLRWMAQRYGQLRDWDVMVTQWLPALARAIELAEHDDWARLMQRAERQRAQRRRRLSEALSSPRFARAALCLLQWAQSAPAPGASLQALAPAALGRGHRRLLAAGRGLPDLPAPDMHRLRILAKRQRYALELLSPMVGRSAPARTLKQLSRLQQTLGEANDFQVLREVIPSLTSSGEILERTERWARRKLRNRRPEAAMLLQRLQRQGYKR